MKAAKHVDKHDRSEPWSNGERCDPKKESQIRNARHRHAQLMHSPTCTAHVHSRWVAAPRAKCCSCKMWKERARRRTVCVVAAGVVAAGVV